ncbi:MAG TPA: murein biosynthesis integral membrane protein MurJ [candidate division Zixibacteria bacterium]|nr:murein biosynthesis integral membrane protein MurJ [candidate division Zixibacteria bacterium]
MTEYTNITPAEQPQVPVPLSEDSGIVRAAAVLAIGNITSRVLGLAREIVKSNLYGASGLLGAYTVAVLVPMTLFNLITGGEMVSSSLVPVFSDYAAKEKRPELWRVVSMVLSLATTFLIIIVILVIWFAPQVAWLAGARNFEDQTLVPITVKLMRLATPAVIFLSISSVLTGVLLALKRFTLPAFTGAVFNGTIVVVALLRPDEISSLVWGLLLGSFFQILLQLPGLRDGKIRITYYWRHPAVRRIVILYTPIVIALVVNQIAIWISFNLAITTGDNSVTYMTYATTLYQFPLGLVVTAVSVATLPTLSRLASSYRQATETHADDAEQKSNDYKETLAGGLRLVITLILPAAAGLFALAVPIIALLLEHGKFTSGDTAITAKVLRVYILGLVFAAVDQMLVIASYARKDTWRPALVGVFSIVIYTITAFALIKPLGLLSLMVADAVKHVVHTIAMILILRRQVGNLSGYQIRASLLKSLLAAISVGIVAYLSATFLSGVLEQDNFLSRLVIVAAAGLAGLGTFVAAVFLLDIRDAKSLRQLLPRRTPKLEP